MRKALAAVSAILFLSACGNTDVRYKVLIGATMVAGPDERPIEDSVIVVNGRKIRSAGMRKDVPIPQNSDRVDLTGKWIVPADGASIGSGEPANLLILDHAPTGVIPANSTDVGGRMIAGEWKIGP